MKFTKSHEKALREYMSKMDRDGCLPVTEWTSGSGRYTTPRALPPFVKRIERQDYQRTNLPKHGTVERTAYRFFNENKRRRAVLVLDIESLFAFLFDSANCKEIVSCQQ